MKELKMSVLFRFSKKTGKIDTTMTGLGDAMMRLWALQNTTKSKACLIAERDTGNVVFLTKGNESGFPSVKDKDLGNVEDYGIPIDFVKSIKDDRFE